MRAMVIPSIRRRVTLHAHTVRKGPAVAFIGIADDVLLRRRVCATVRHLMPVGKPAPPRRAGPTAPLSMMASRSSDSARSRARKPPMGPVVGIESGSMTPHRARSAASGEATEYHRRCRAEADALRFCASAASEQAAASAAVTGVGDNAPRVSRPRPGAHASRAAGGRFAQFQAQCCARSALPQRSRDFIRPTHAHPHRRVKTRGRQERGRPPAHERRAGRPRSQERGAPARRRGAFVEPADDTSVDHRRRRGCAAPGQ